MMIGEQRYLLYSCKDAVSMSLTYTEMICRNIEMSLRLLSIMFYQCGLANKLSHCMINYPCVVDIVEAHWPICFQ